ncbi:hypothetical protein T07_8059 [Trichinella nelsoni]|uniref:CCHC-type domain-containing protein n=1 Tax=Trichinella nelsoni TaxID=6336 RepID=A0A0V0S001_9BILA|nr:hypothetical protein T07_8059 [Trichinella nelsoni]
MVQADWEQDLGIGIGRTELRHRRLGEEPEALFGSKGVSLRRLRQKQDDRLSRGDGGDSGNSGQAAAPTRIGKLPVLPLPQFSGEVLEFPKFWAQFEASAHGRTDLDAATKFAYLLSNTAGRARSAIAGIPVTADHYPEAVGILQKRFGRPKIVARAHFLALWKLLECREMTRQSIQALMDEITEHLVSCSDGKDPHAGELPLSEALMPGLKDKFPRALQRAWDLKVSTGPESEDNLENLMEFAKLQADLLSPTDGLSFEESGREKSGETTRKGSRSVKRRERDRVTSSAAALVTSVQRVCPSAKRFLNADYSARTSLSREKGVCYKCLKIGHRASECRKGRPCGVDGCRKPHHQLLHPPAAMESVWSPVPDSSHQGLLAARRTAGGCLQTVRAHAFGPDGNHVVVNCLSDTGAEVPFIQKDVAEVLGLTGSHERCRFTTLESRVRPERRLRRVQFQLGAVGSSGRPEASTLVKALAIPRVCGKVQPLPGKRSDGAPAEPEMGQRQGTPLVIDVLIVIDYY